MTTRYLALAAGTATGLILSPAPRTFATPVDAQLANPTGTLYEVKPDEAADTLEVFAVADSNYPLDLIETRSPGIGCNAEGAHTLRDLGPRKPHRWSTHFRNDQLGGYHGGTYHSDFSEAVEAFAEGSARTLRMTALRFKVAEPA